MKAEKDPKFKKLLQ